MTEILVTNTAETTSEIKEKRLAAGKVLAQLSWLHKTHRDRVVAAGQAWRKHILLSELRGNEGIRAFAEASLGDVTPSTAFDIAAYAGAMKVAAGAATIRHYLGQIDVARGFLDSAETAKLSDFDATRLAHCPEQMAIDAAAKTPAARRTAPFPGAPRTITVSTPWGRP